MKAKPFVAWPGGKSRLLKEIIPRFPESFRRYYEPFLGGGSVFLGAGIHKVSYLSDINEDLVNCFRQVRDNPYELIRELEAIKYQMDTHEERFFRQIRDDYSPTNEIKKAARFIFLSRTSYKSGSKFQSQLLGKQYRYSIYSKSNIIKCSYILKGSMISCRPYISSIGDRDDFFYLDPPYFNVSSGMYKDDLTTFKEHTTLRNHCIEIDQGGAKFMLSNSCNDQTLDLYKDFNIIKVKVNYPMKRRFENNYKGDYEIIVRNY